MRPLYQEIVLPNVCYVGGPNELRYWMQLKTYFDDNICDKEIKELEFQINSLQKSLESLFVRQSSERKKIAMPTLVIRNT